MTQWWCRCDVTVTPPCLSNPSINIQILSFKYSCSSYLMAEVNHQVLPCLNTITAQQTTSIKKRSSQFGVEDWCDVNLWPLGWTDSQTGSKTWSANISASESNWGRTCSADPPAEFRLSERLMNDRHVRNVFSVHVSEVSVCEKRRSVSVKTVYNRNIVFRGRSLCCCWTVKKTCSIKVLLWFEGVNLFSVSATLIFTHSVIF